MAWQYFTAPLSPGEIITQDQRNELLDAFVERQHAASGSEVNRIDSAMLAAVKDSPVITDKLYFDPVGGGLGAAVRPIALELTGISTLFRPAPESAAYTSTTYRSAVAAAVGITTSELSALWATNRVVDVAHYWNALWHGIRLLQHVQRGSSVGTRLFRGNTATTSQPWDEFATDVWSSAASDIGPGSLQFLAAAYRIAGPERRNAQLLEYVMRIQTLVDLDGTLNLWAGVSTGADVYPDEESLTVEGTAPQSHAISAIPTGNITATPYQFTVPYTAAGGLIEFRVRSGAWDSLATLLAYEPEPDEPEDEVYFSASFQTLLGDIVLSPNFTHP